MRIQVRIDLMILAIPTPCLLPRQSRVLPTMPTFLTQPLLRLHDCIQLLVQMIQRIAQMTLHAHISLALVIVLAEAARLLDHHGGAHVETVLVDWEEVDREKCFDEDSAAGLGATVVGLECGV